NNALGAQAGGGSRGTGLFYDLYGKDHSASAMTAWAWGVSRLIDVIESSDSELIDATRLGVTGCSRNGKGALLAGAMDERIALSIVQESGAGGAVSWRVAQAMAAKGVNVQTLSHAAGEQPWFRESFGHNFGGDKVSRLPFDHHQLMGMVAPRGLLVFDNTIDWLGPKAAFIATTAAKEIYHALGAADNIAYSENGSHVHCQLPEHQRDLLGAFVQRFLLDQPGETAVLRSTQATNDDLTPWINWTTPVLK
ncbi:MAG TPA: dockerin-like protein, partial [Cellvibrionaceae bacterium]